MLAAHARPLAPERLRDLAVRYGETLLHLVGMSVLVAYWSLLPTIGGDAATFWALDLADPYGERWGGTLAYVYSPAFAQLISPLTQLPYDAFYKVWTAISVTALAWVLTPAGAAVALLIPFVRMEIESGQVHLWLAVMCAIGLRHPQAWSFGLLTKVTPGVGLLWFAARREWAALRVAAVTTLAIVGVSALVHPSAWVDWLGLLVQSGTLHMDNLAWSEWPAAYRLPLAAGLVVVAGWRDRPAALPMIVCFALPAIWPWAVAMLAASVRPRPRWRWEPDAPSGDAHRGMSADVGESPPAKEASRGIIAPT